MCLRPGCNSLGGLGSCAVTDCLGLGIDSIRLGAVKGFRSLVCGCRPPRVQKFLAFGVGWDG